VCVCVCVCERETDIHRQREKKRETWVWIYALSRNGTDNASVNLTCDVFQIVTSAVITYVEDDLK